MSQQQIDSTTNKACPHKTTNNNNIITPGASSVSLSPSTPPWLSSRPVPSSFSPSPVVASHDSHCVVRWSTTTNHPRAPRAITTLALYLPLVHISSCSSIIGITNSSSSTTSSVLRRLLSWQDVLSLFAPGIRFC